MSFEDIGLLSKCEGVISPRQYISSFIDGDDFVTSPIDDEDYAFTNATAGTMALDPAAENGVLLLDSASTTAAQGAQIQRPAASFKPKAGRKIWFETRVKVADTATGPELFIGLAEIDTTIIASSAVSTENHIGFSSVTDDNVLLANSEKATAGTTATGTTAVEATWVTLGIKVDGLDKVSFYVDGDIVSQITTTANIPIVELAPSFVCQSGGTTDPILHIDYWICQQTR